MTQMICIQENALKFVKNRGHDCLLILSPTKKSPGFFFLLVGNFIPGVFSGLRMVEGYFTFMEFHLFILIEVQEKNQIVLTIVLANRLFSRVFF